MTRQAISTANAPAAMGPYSQAIVAGDLVFCAGQIPLDPATGEIAGSSIEEQTERVLRNVGAVLDAAGVTFADVVKTTVFMADLGEFTAMNGVYAGFFPDPPPARSTFGVAALPRGAKVEIECIARRPEGRRAGLGSLDAPSGRPYHPADQAMTPHLRPSGTGCSVGDHRPAHARRRA